MVNKTSRRNVLKAGGALGLASVGWLSTLVPEIRSVRAKPQIPKARSEVLTGPSLEKAVEGVLASPHVAPFSARLAERGFVRTEKDEGVSIVSATRGQDQLIYIWYAHPNGDRARLTDLASNSKLTAITFITPGAPGSHLADTHQLNDIGELVHTEHGVLGPTHGTVTYIATGITKTLDLPPATMGDPAPQVGVLTAEAEWCFGQYCGPGCNWVNGHACSISCGITGTLFCALCCLWWGGVPCGLAWVFICEYGWSCNTFTCCLVGLCCCA
jgi:hypothetical protein